MTKGFSNDISLCFEHKPKLFKSWEHASTARSQSRGGQFLEGFCFKMLGEWVAGLCGFGSTE